MSSVKTWRGLQLAGQLKREQIGASSVEWAVLASLIAVAVIVAILAVGQNLGDLFERARNCIVNQQC